MAGFEFNIESAKRSIFIALSGVSGPVNINIYNQQGQRVLGRQVAASTTISIAHLSKGMYTVQLMALK